MVYSVVKLVITVLALYKARKPSNPHRYLSLSIMLYIKKIIKM